MRKHPDSPKRPHNSTHPHTEIRETRAEAEQSVSRRDVAVAELAADERGVLSARELRECGLDGDAVSTRARTGRLHRRHRGVYAVGHASLTLEAEFLAAVKACGASAALSHFAAASYDGLIEWDESWPIDVTVVGRGTRHHDGLRIHLTNWLERRDLIYRDGIWLTAPWRTILDLAAYLPERRLRRVVRQALSERRLSIRQLVDVLERGGPRRGSRKLRRVLADAVPSRSDLEDIVLDLILAGGFVPPDVNRLLLVDGRRLYPDFRWPEKRLIVEADSRKWHDNPIARADDVERQRLLEASGERVERVTWDDAIARTHATQKRLARAGAPHLPHRDTRTSG